MNRLPRFVVGALLLLPAVAFAQAAEKEKTAPRGSEQPLLATLAKEADDALPHLKSSEGPAAYYLAYTITDTTSLSIGARLGALLGDDRSRARVLDVDLRVGDHALDNTRQIRGGRGGGGFGQAFGGATAIGLDDEPAAIRHAIWRATNDAFQSAVERYQRVVANSRTMVEETVPTEDFSHETPSVHEEPDVTITLDRAAWEERVRAVSAMALEQPRIESSSVSVVATAENRSMASSEGTRLKTGRKLLRVVLSASAKADDGMDIQQSFLFNSATEEHLPSEAEMRAAMQKVFEQVLALREAPLVEPYTGPAILLNRASGVFFHEIFGHRIEGHRQKNVEEGQTFTKMIGEPVLPSFLSVVDDPTLARHGEEDLRGSYRFDDEGIPAQRVTLVEDGVLRTFLLSRSPVPGFERSNGHGRREPGRDAVSRQGNLMVLSKNAMPFAKLRERLVALCKEQGKPYGFLFEDITGGFTTTSRGGPQAFKVEPVVVYRIYADGRPDELVRGVDIVGTPLSCFSRIVATSDDTAVFNGTCGAESGWVPVSAISPSILVEQIEIEKKQRSQDRPPLLATPVGLEPPSPEEAAGGAEARDVVVRALQDELARHGTLKLPDLDAPYFVEYAVTERASHAIAATLGAIVRSEPSRSRTLRTDVRVGSYELDNTNFAGGGGGFAGFGGGGRRPGGLGGGGGVALPQEDDYTAIRQAAWRATDAAYKDAVETLAQKMAALGGRDATERIADFAPREASVAVGEKAALDFDAPAWEARLRRVSARFRNHRQVVDSGADLQVSADTDFLVNTEGTRVRAGAQRATLVLRAEVQAEDGERIADRTALLARNAAGLPSEEQLVAAVDALAERLARVAAAKRLESYTGPVLFDGIAAPQLFQALLARGVAATPAPVGGGRRRAGGGDGLDKLMGKRLLPESFQVWDDPRPADLDGQHLAGHYALDDEGVAPERVELVKSGKLVGMVSSRTPTEHAASSNGHGRGGRATIGAMYVEAAGGLDEAALKQALLDAAKEQGLKYALRVSALSAGGPGGNLQALIARARRGGGRGAGGGGGGAGGGLADPLVITRISVEDGREEPVRSCEFDSVTVAALRDIVAAGNRPVIWNTTGGAGTSVIAPAVILESVSLYGIEEDAPKKPVLPPPAER